MRPSLFRFVRYITWIAGLALMGVTACTTSPEVREIAAGPMYPAGYHDGCRTAIEAGKSFSAHATHNKGLFDTEEDYRAGWRQGFIACKRETFTSVENSGDLGERAGHF